MPQKCLVYLGVFHADGIKDLVKVWTSEVSPPLESGEHALAGHLLEVLLTNVLKERTKRRI